MTVRPGIASRLDWVGPLVIVLAIAVIFGRAGGHAWLHWDDDKNLWQNPDFNPVRPAAVAGYWTHPHAELYAPVTYTAWGLLAAMGERRGPAAYSLSPRPFHLANLFVHAAAAIGVLTLLRQLGMRAWAALAGALLYALHPLQVEAVAWASGLKDLLAGAFGIWALVCYVRSATTNRDEPEASKATAGRWYIAATALFLAAMLAKPQAVALPLLAAAIDRLLIGRNWRQIRDRVVLWLLLAVPIIVIGHLVQPGGVARSDTSVAARPLVALDDLTFYLSKLVWPARLTIDYAHTTARLLASDRRWWTWIPPVLLAAVCIITRRRFPWLAASAAIFAAALLPVLGLVPFEFQDVSNVADHYAYLAMLGPAMLAAIALGWLSGRTMGRPAAAVLATLLIVACGAASWLQVGHWRDDESLFTHALAANPDAVRARIHLAALRVRQDRPADAQRLYDEALSLDPTDPIANFNYANLLRQQNRLADAIEHYRRAIERSPNEAPFHTNLGITLLHTGQIDAAIAELQRSAELDPNNKLVWMTLGSTLAQRGDLATAAAALTQALEIDPTFTPAQQLLDQVRGAMRQSPPPSSR